MSATLEKSLSLEDGIGLLDVTVGDTRVQVPILTLGDKAYLAAGRNNLFQVGTSDVDRVHGSRTPSGRIILEVYDPVRSEDLPLDRPDELGLHSQAPGLFRQFVGAIRSMYYRK